MSLPQPSALLRALGLSLLLATTGLSPAARADEPVAATEADPVAALAELTDDPDRYAQGAQQALAAGDKALAQRFSEAELDRREISRYLPISAGLRKALLAERIGDLDLAATQFRSQFADDPLRAMQVLRILSVHPDRDALVTELIAHLRALAAAAEAGQPAMIYRTKAGDPRYLEVIDEARLLEAMKTGERLSYCYLPHAEITQADGSHFQGVNFNRCLIGDLRISGVKVDQLVLTGIALGDLALGKTWEGEANKSATRPASSFDDLVMRDAVFLGKANFSGVKVLGGRAYFPLAVFEGPADFRGATFEGVTDFRFASFGRDATFRDLRMFAPVYFGGARFRHDTVFTGVYSQRDLYFNDTVFEGSVSFDRCEWLRASTFEHASFLGPVTFQTTRIIAKRLNLSRATFYDTVVLKEVALGGLDAFGAHFHGDLWVTDAVIEGRTRFSLDPVTRTQNAASLEALLPLYRDYQGDEDADAPLTNRSSYGVVALDDLTAQIAGNVSFANTTFGGLTVFDGVNFGSAGGEPTVASFYNAQFTGETHFERAQFSSIADFTTIFGKELAFNEAYFDRALLLDDAYIQGRLTLTDATFGPDATWSWFASAITQVEVDPEQVAHPDGGHRLFWGRCARGEFDRNDLRAQRLRSTGADEAQLQAICFERIVDEWIALKQSYGDRAMTSAEDDAYWQQRHFETLARFHEAGLLHKLWIGLIDFGLFELCFGWGVRLGNLGLASLVVTVLFAGLYRIFCAETILVYDGESIRIRDVSFSGLLFVSLQSLIAINTGWDFGDDDHRFRTLNTLETLIGFIVMTFFVGAYTRMILS